MVAEIKKAGGKAVANYDSVADYQKAGAMVRQCVETFGKIDILVNVAGMLREKMIWNMSEDDFDAVVSVHLKGHWNMSHHAIKYMRNAGYGRIINFSSDAFKGSVGQCNYAAAKAGIIGLTRSIAKECYKFGITANAMCPAADTRMMMNDAVIANQKRKFEAGLITKEQYDRFFAGPRSGARRADRRLSRDRRGRLHQRPDLPRREGPHQHLHLRRRLPSSCTTTARSSPSTN